MQVFYLTDIQEQQAFIGEEEARHFQVLRKQLGDVIHFMDGKGHSYQGEIIALNKRRGTIQILKKKQQARERMFHLHIAIAPTKNMARMEWFVEKVTELGIDEITPIFCQQSERTKIRLDRLEKIAISAMKQSLRSYLPKINAPVKMNQLLSNYQSETARLNKYIAHCESTKKVNLWDTYRMGKDALILIGPEGDFSSQEIEQALSLNFKAISLGTHRLRTETAGITACNVINIVNQKGEI